MEPWKGSEHLMVCAARFALESLRRGRVSEKYAIEWLEATAALLKSTTQLVIGMTTRDAGHSDIPLSVLVEEVHVNELGLGVNCGVCRIPGV